MALNANNNVALDEHPTVRPLAGAPAPEQGWDEVDAVEEDLDDEDVLLPEEAVDAEPEATEEEELEEDDGFRDDERDPFTRVRPPLVVPAVGGVEIEAVDGETIPEERATIILDGAVYARIADCLRAAIVEADERLAHARELAVREPFYAGYIDVLEGQRRRYVTALERAVPLASAVEATAANGESDTQPAQPA